jgi:EAL domain-containing protein (putative c-di-GMP-specific phosphodiesterase class I)
MLAVTVSIGVSFYPKDGKDANELLKNADAALYHAKEMGRNTYQFYQSEFNEHILKRAELTTALRQALERKEFFLKYQPLIRLNSNDIIGLEALIRWNHPTLGVILPDKFISIAEEAGLIVAIGEWVLRTACLQCKIWQQSSPGICMAVNVSGYQFKQENFIAMIKSVLNETGLDPRLLELEITESVILNNVTDVSQKMHELKKIGVSLSMDDFGTGYASLNYLKLFPFDKLKIDKSFIDGIASVSEDQSIVEAIINMTKSMGLQVLAEGVEKKEQVDFLREHHSNQVQGYYFSEPLDEKNCTELLQNHVTYEKEV